MEFSFSHARKAFARYALPVAALLVLVLAVGGCRKEDTEYPVLTVGLSSAGSTFDFDELIGFSISASDNEGLREIGAVVMNAAGVPVLGAVQTSGGGNTTMQWNSSVHHNDPYLPTGTYTIRFFADDGHNISYAFRTVTLNTLPLQLEKVLLVEPGTGSTEVFAIATDGSKISQAILGMEASVASANSREGLLLIGGRQWEGIELLDKISYSTVVSIPTPSGQSPDLFNHVIFDSQRNRHFISCRDEFIREVGSSSITGIFSLEPWIPGVSHVYEGELVVSLHNALGTEFAIGFIQLSTGQLTEVLETDMDVKAFLGSDGEDLWVLGNVGNEAVVHRLNRGNPSLYDPDGMAGPADTSPFISATLLPSGNWLVVQESGSRMYPSGGTGTGTYIDEAASAVLVEPVNDFVYLVLSDEVLVYRENFGAEATIPHNGGHPMVIAVYNK